MLHRLVSSSFLSFWNRNTGISENVYLKAWVMKNVRVISYHIFTTDRTVPDDTTTASGAIAGES